MFVRVTATPNSPRKAVKVVESVRVGLKVKQVLLHYVGVAEDQKVIEKLKRLGREFIAKEELRREAQSPQGSLFDVDTFEKRLDILDHYHARKQQKKKLGRKPTLKLENVTSQDRILVGAVEEDRRVIEGIHDVAGHVYDQIGYDHLLKRVRDKELLKDLVLLRLANPVSKLQTKQILDKDYNRTHDLDAIYRLMDQLYPQIGRVKALTFHRTQQLIPDPVDVIFFDCTTLYFESVNTDDLRQFGYSKDCRFNTTQVVLALATNSDGLPIGYELFAGNKAEVKTLLACLESWRQSFTIGAVCFVGDRAMMSKENLDLLTERQHHYVIAAKLRNLPGDVQKQIFFEHNYVIQDLGKDLAWVGEFEHQGHRLIVSYKTDRARRDAHQREQKLGKLKKRVGTEGNTRNLITNQAALSLTTSQSSKTHIDPEKIERDAQWDGLHGIITNIQNEPPGSLLARYAKLWKIEESFRMNKHILSMRPIYHWKPERIHAHITLCYMAFSVLRYMEYVVQLTQKITPEVLRDELTHVQASIYIDHETGTYYRIPGKFSHLAAKIYKAFQLQRNCYAQKSVPTQTSHIKNQNDKIM